MKKKKRKNASQIIFYLLHVEMTILWIYWATQTTVLQFISCVFAFLNIVVRKFKMIYVALHCISIDNTDADCD